MKFIDWQSKKILSFSKAITFFDSVENRMI